MRTIKLTVAVMAMAALVAVVPMAASGAISDFEQKQQNKIKKASNKAGKAINQVADLEDSLASSNSSQDNKNATQDERISGVESTVATIVAGVPEIVNALTALQDGLVTVGNGLTAIQAALQNPTTGLVGLNNARPQFAAFGDGGGLIASTGTQGGKGPTENAVNAPGADGVYLVDFQNDVSSKFMVVAPFPGGSGGTGASGTSNVGQAINCTLASATCNAFSIPVSQYPETVLVTIFGQPGGPGTAVAPADRDFSIAAFSG